jgi:lysophospholipase L1-like esterase
MDVNGRISWPTICVFGDSIVHGSNDPGGGWVELIRRRFDEEGRPDVYNLGIGADRTFELLRRLPVEAAARNPDVIVLGIGVNDLEWEGRDETGEAGFRDRYRALLGEALRFTPRVLALGLLRTTPSDVHGVTNDQILACEEIISGLAAEHGLAFLSLLDALAPADLDDGLHPNASGHAKLASVVAAELARRGWDGVQSLA